MNTALNGSTATKCENCQRYLGEDITGDIYCKCQHYNRIIPGQKTKLIHKSLYTKATAPMTG